MHPSIITFCEQDSPVQGTKSIEYLAKLVILNRGRMLVEKIGGVEPTEDNPYKRLGLLPEEAFHLMQMGNFINGMLFALGNPNEQKEFMDKLQREIQRLLTGSKLYFPTGLEISDFGRT